MRRSWSASWRARATKPSTGISSARAVSRNAGGGEQRLAGRAPRAAQALAQHLAALAEGGLGDALERARGRNGSGLGARHQAHDRRGHLGRRHEGRRRDVEQDFRLACASRPARRAGRSSCAPGAATMRSATSRWNISTRHVVPRRPRLDAEPAHQQRGRDVVGQVGDDADGAGRVAEMRRGSNVERIARRPREPARDSARRSRRAPRSRARRARPRSRGAAPSASSARVRPPGPGPTSTTVTPSSGPPARAMRAGQVEVEQEILAERLLRG